MKARLEQELRAYYKKGLDVAQRECTLNLPPELEAYVVICAVDKEKIFREATLQQLKGDDMTYTQVLQELVDDLKINQEATYERKQALLKLKEAHMWLKAGENKNGENELNLIKTSEVDKGGVHV